MDEQHRRRVSRILAKVLRHQPGRLGLILGDGGWVSVSDLLAALAKHGHPIARKELELAVNGGAKRRFSFDESCEKIRANYGHSVDVDLKLEPSTPPDVLYHGTSEATLSAILEEGVKSLSRSKVHLSIDIASAVEVGRRHGKPVVLEIDALGLCRSGFTLWQSSSGVWLIDEVPPGFLRVVDDGPDGEH